MITKETEDEVIMMVGQYIVDHAEELYMVKCSDMFGDEIFIHIKRRKDVDIGDGGNGER